MTDIRNLLHRGEDAEPEQVTDANVVQPDAQLEVEKTEDRPTSQDLVPASEYHAAVARIEALEAQANAAQLPAPAAAPRTIQDVEDDINLVEQFQRIQGLSLDSLYVERDNINRAGQPVQG